jgi:DNA-binding winged helix-turn-helix (wHTH) protein/Tol biopolymer transport system component
VLNFFRTYWGEVALQPSLNGRSRLRFGQFEVDLLEKRLLKLDRPVRLENKPFQVLVTLLDRQGEVVTREELRARLWPDGTYVDFDEGLNTAIKKLRFSLGDSADTPVFVETVPRRGYRFLAPITVVHAQMSPADDGQPISASAARMTVPAAITETEPVGGAASRVVKPRWRRRVAAFVTMSLLVTAIGWMINRKRSSADNSQSHVGMRIRKLTDTGDAGLVAIAPDGRFVVYVRRVGEEASLRMRQVESSGDVEILPPEAVNFVGLTFSPDGNNLYFARSDKNDPGFKYLYVMPALGGPARKLITDIDSPVCFSPDGRQFVFTRGIPTKNSVEVRVANANGTDEHLLLSLPESYVGVQPGATWSPDGKTITVAVRHRGKEIRSSLYTIAVAHGSLRELFSSDALIGRPVWSRKGNAIHLALSDPGTHRRQLWTISYPKGERQRITNDLSDYDLILDITRDDNTAVTIEGTTISNVWTWRTGQASQGTAITSGETPMSEAVETADNKLIVTGPDQLWMMNPDGSQRTLFAEGDVDHLATCGDSVLADPLLDGLRHILRFGPDGHPITTLAIGNVFSPACSPDGKLVYYVDLNPPQRIFRVPVEGGAPFEIAQIPGDGIVGFLDVSHDGKFLAFPWERYSPVPTLQFGVISTSTGSLVQSVKSPSGVYDIGQVRWSADDSAVQYLVTRGGVTNLWEQSLAGGSPKQLTNFTSDLAFSFNWSRDHKRVFFARGRVTSDVVLLSNFR